MTKSAPHAHTSWSELRHGRGDQPTESAATRFELDLGQLIYDLRTKAGLSQGELAERMGTTQSAISRSRRAVAQRTGSIPSPEWPRRWIGTSCCRSPPRSPTQLTDAVQVA